MLKRNAAVILVAGLVLGGGALAWANGGPARPTLLAATQATDSTDPTTPPSSAPATAQERKARREALRTCLQQAGEDKEARRGCFKTAGVRPGHGARKGHGLAGAAGLLGRAVHGSVVVPGADGGWQTVTFDRGEVDEATDGSHIVLDRPDGPEVTLALTADTRYHGIAGAGAIEEGRPATVVSRDGKALHVVQKDPARSHGPGNNDKPAGVPHD